MKIRQSGIDATMAMLRFKVVSLILLALAPSMALRTTTSVYQAGVFDVACLVILPQAEDTLCSCMR